MRLKIGDRVRVRNHVVPEPDVEGVVTNYSLTISEEGHLVTAVFIDLGDGTSALRTGRGCTYEVLSPQ
jgi:hypothetical protein